MHDGDVVYAVNLPYCTTLGDAQKVADAGRKTGNAYNTFMQNDNCKNGRGPVLLVRQVDKFPDATTDGGFRYIVEVSVGETTIYGILKEPVIPAATGPFI